MTNMCMCVCVCVRWHFIVWMKMLFHFSVLICRILLSCHDFTFDRISRIPIQTALLIEVFYSHKVDGSASSSSLWSVHSPIFACKLIACFVFFHLFCSIYLKSVTETIQSRKFSNYHLLLVADSETPLNVVVSLQGKPIGNAMLFYAMRRYIGRFSFS